MSSIVVGINSYVTVTDADTYIQTFTTSSELIHIWWESLSTADQEVYLIRSAKRIDSLPLCGVKTLATQLMAFPRDGDTAVPTEVIEAQILNSYFLSLPVIDSPTARGIKRYKIGNLEEEFFGPQSDIFRYVGREAQELLQPWTQGGFLIR